MSPPPGAHCAPRACDTHCMLPQYLLYMFLALCTEVNQHFLCDANES